jgi:hypothetical protein
LDLAHTYWKQIVNVGDIVIDATCGNGHDTLALALLALEKMHGTIYAFDIQSSAIEKTKLYLKNRLSDEEFKSVNFFQMCHSSFPTEIKAETVKLIAYNLGYLPGGDKKATSQSKTTLVSVKAAQDLVQDGGAISITCYPGHPEGQREENELLLHCQQLSPKLWSCCHHRWLNRHDSPSLLLIQRQKT